MKDGPIKVPTKYIALYIALTLRLVHRQDCLVQPEDKKIQDNIKFFFGFVHPRPTTRLPWAWEATPYNGSLCEYVEVGESKITQNMGKYIWVGKIMVT